MVDYADVIPPDYYTKFVLIFFIFAYFLFVICQLSFIFYDFLFFDIDINIYKYKYLQSSGGHLTGITNATGVWNSGYKTEDIKWLGLLSSVLESSIVLGRGAHKFLGPGPPNCKGGTDWD